MFTEVFDQFHYPGCSSFKNNQRNVLTDNRQEIMPSLTVGEVVTLFNLGTFSFTCTCIDGTPHNILCQAVEVSAERATKHAINAFEILMAGGRCGPSKMTSR